MTATVARLRRLAPVTAIVQELVRFFMQLMENPEISGVEYQQGARFANICWRSGGASAPTVTPKISR